MEVVIGASISLATVGGLMVFSRFQQMTWLDGLAAVSVQSSAQQAFQQIVPDIRAARRVIPSLSSSTRLTLQLPLYDGSGNLVVPLQDGNRVAYYLSDRTGNTQAAGDILWRSVNGVPDSRWSMRGTAGRTVLGPQALSYDYNPPLDAHTVTVNIDATATAGNRSSKLSTSQEVLLRNHGL